MHFSIYLQVFYFRVDSSLSQQVCLFKCLHPIIAVMCWIALTDCFYFRREKGTYYALHLGGTYFRILRVHLGGQRSYLDVQDVERHPIPSHLMNSTSEVTNLLFISYQSLLVILYADCLI